MGTVNCFDFGFYVRSKYIKKLNFGQVVREDVAESHLAKIVTPGGVGMSFNPPKYMKAGDKILCYIENIGELINFVE